MDSNRVLEVIYAELQRTKIGEQFESSRNDAAWYRLLLGPLLASTPLAFEDDLRERLPSIITGRAVPGIEGAFAPDCLVVKPSGKIVVKKPTAGDACLYWTGEVFTHRQYPGVEKEWSNEFEMFAASVAKIAKTLPQPVTILELGSGTDAVTLYLIDTAKRLGLQLEFVNVERDANALAFGVYLSRLHGLSIEHVPMDIAASLGNPNSLAELKARIGTRTSLLVMTHNALHPFYTTEQYDRLFPYLIGELGAVAGVHLERNGFRTATYRSLLAMLPNGYSPPIARPFLEWESDPFAFIADNASALKVEITDRTEIAPHFPLRHFPSFLAWKAL